MGFSWMTTGRAKVALAVAIRLIPNDAVMAPTTDPNVLVLMATIRLHIALMLVWV